MSRPLNFLHLTTFYPPYSFGGDAMYLYRLCHALGDLGHSVDVVHCRDAYHLLHPALPEIEMHEHPNVRRHELRSGWNWVSPLLTQQTGYPLLKAARIQRILNSKRYDVIHYHNMSLLGAKTLVMRPADGVPVKLYTTHEHWLVCPMHVLWKFNSRACEKPECLRCTIQGKRPPQLWRYTGQLARASRHVDRFVSPSRFTARMHADRGFPMPVAHLPYFIERADGDWQNPAPRPHQAPYFLFVGRLELIKGLQTVIPLWDKLPDYDLLVVGAGNYEAELKRQAASNPRIKFLGPLPQSKLAALYRHALAVIVPSITYETFGIIIIEAFARKTPVIVRNLGALPEVVDDSRGGFTYNTDGELMAAMARIAKSPALGNELGENGYRAFLKWWTREAHMKLYFEFLEDAAKSRYGHVPWKSTGQDKENEYERGIACQAF